MWSKKYCDTNPNMILKDVIGNFLEYIQFHKIPANVLMREVHPLGLVPYSIIMNALAYQVRRDTLLKLRNFNGNSLRNLNTKIVSLKALFSYSSLSKYSNRL